MGPTAWSQTGSPSNDPPSVSRTVAVPGRDPSSAGPMTGEVAWLLSTLLIARSTGAGTAHPVTRLPMRAAASVEAATATPGMSLAGATLAPTGGTVPATRMKISSNGAAKRHSSAAPSPTARCLIPIEDD